MGYCYDQHKRLCCDICGISGEVRKVPCPVGWCQPVAACPDCRKAKKHVPDDKHAHCREQQRLKAEGIAAMKAGKCSIVLKPLEPTEWDSCTDQYRPIKWDHYSTACDIFYKTWLEPQDIELLRSWGNTVEVAA